MFGVIIVLIMNIWRVSCSKLLCFDKKIDKEGNARNDCFNRSIRGLINKDSMDESMLFNYYYYFYDNISGTEGNF